MTYINAAIYQGPQILVDFQTWVIINDPFFWVRNFYPYPHNCGEHSNITMQRYWHLHLADGFGVFAMAQFPNIIPYHIISYEWQTKFLTPAMDMATVGGPLSVVKVCHSMLCAKIYQKYRVSVSG